MVVTFTLSVVLSTQSMYADFPSWSSQKFYQQGRFGSMKILLRELRLVSSVSNPIEACCCVIQQPSCDRKKV